MGSSKTDRRVLKVIPLIVVPVAFLASASSLKTALGTTATLVIAAAAAIFVMGYSLYLSSRWERGLDEVQAAGGTLAAKRGMTIGPIIFVLLLLLPPFLDMMTAVIGDAAGVPADRKVVTLAMTFGFGAVVILQTVTMVVFNMLWWRARR